MSSSGEFERACAEVERASSTAVKSAATVGRLARQLVKAAQEGDISKLHKAAERLQESQSAMRQDAANASAAWPYTAEQEEELLRSDYESELIDEARGAGLTIRRQDERLVAYPSLIRVLPQHRALEVDRKRITALRPSRVVAALKQNQDRKPSTTPEQFLEILYAAYRLLTKQALGETVVLARLYEALTLLPSVRKDYAKSDFARDVFALDRSSVATTKSGARLSLPASTGTKSATGHFTFISPEGEPVTYYGIRFAEVMQ